MSLERLISVPEMSNGDMFVFGRTLMGKHACVEWNPDAKWMLNGNTLIGGQSGTGKTRLLKEMIRWLSSQKKTIKVIDFQGDMAVQGETVYEIRARYDKSEHHYAINPFEFDKDLKNGGPTVHSALLADIFKKALFPNMGPIQKQMFKQMIMDVYYIAGITEDSTTWTQELPTITDLSLFHEKLLQMLGDNQLWKINQRINKVLKLRTEHSGGSDEINEKIDKEISSLCTTMVALGDFAKHKIEDDENEWNIDIKINLEPYYSKKSQSKLESLSPYIKEMSSMTIFLGERVPLDTIGHVRFDISGLTNASKPSQAIFFSELVMQAEFRRVKLRGEYSMLTNKIGKRFDTAIIVDESKLVLPVGKEKDNPYHIAHRINTEGRKFGLISISATQSFSHYSDDILKNAGAKIILNCDGKEHKVLKSSYSKINDGLLSRISTFGIALVDTGKNGFETVVLPWADKKALGIEEVDEAF
ncbi:MAG: hypothetical protein COB67_00190 [SAR324 cluster bacterium]|uniref:Uncharacterized protein n=1 Tax=SAR324 cluster bacterium TaxID=2024889 RepID=A0A2A4TBK7_9DELT|nr:MAG: hypothetical protein COB67_00190 [SAR324 cluster bacterium]